jgi:hypothetical protein
VDGDIDLLDGWTAGHGPLWIRLTFAARLGVLGVVPDRICITLRWC